MKPKKKIRRKHSKSFAKEDYMSNQLNKTGYSEIYRDKEKKKIAKAESRNDAARKAIKDEARGIGTKRDTKKAIRKSNRAERRLGFKKGEVSQALYKKIMRDIKK
ncbi:MAG: hypothetical protein CMI60_15385 [Parvibaculum sp.]|nr:hypothetical protein [Parvibaculum sp.]|tara:strand:+ start:290 stop:604 length:315 start_codon:yes stop_codon:yes gene_type:complete